MVSLKLGFLTQDLTVTSRRFVAITLLVSGTLAWFFLINTYLVVIFENFILDPFWIDIGKTLFFLTGITSAIIGSLISNRNSRGPFLWIWIIIGLISSVSIALFQGIFSLILTSILLGVSLGLGLPTVLSCLADCTTIEERGRVAGVSILMTFLMAFIAIALFNMLGEGILAIAFLSFIIRSTSLIALISKIYEPNTVQKQKWQFKPDYKEFAFYIFPWFMFVVASVIASNLVPVTPAYDSAKTIGTILRFAFIAIFGLVWGVVADRVGRKQPIIIGLIILGLSFALLGFGEMTPDNVVIYLAMSGVAWGSFLTIYLIIPGDFSSSNNREKFYALGTISPLFAMFGVSMLSTTVFNTSFFQILSIILFLSVMPILRAKETLKESKIQERRMKDYAKKVGRIAEESKKDE